MSTFSTFHILYTSNNKKKKKQTADLFAGNENLYVLNEKILYS